LQAVRAGHGKLFQIGRQRHLRALRSADLAFQLGRSAYPSRLGAQDAAVEFKLVAATVEDVDEPHALWGRTDLVDDLAPDYRFPILTPKTFGPVGFLLDLATIMNHLGCQAGDFPAVGTDHQRRVQEESASPAIARRTQTADLNAGKVCLCRIADDQPRSIRAGAGCCMVRRRDGRKTHIVVVDQAVGRFAVAPRFRLFGRCVSIAATTA